MSFNHNVRKYYGGGGLLERLINGIKSRVNDPNQPKAWGYSTPQEKQDIQQPTAPQDYSWMKGGTRQRTAEEEAKLKDPAIQKYLNRQQSSATQPSAPATVSSKKTPINWGNKFNDFVGGLSQEQQNWLKTNGLNDATKLQEYLNNMGFSVGKFGADGKFGKDSKTAWSNFTASGIMGKNRDQEILAEKQQPVIDAPDPFGYESKGNYSLDNAKTLKTDGIRDWTTMLNYIKGNQDSTFAQDMMHRFGSDLSKWKQEDVEGTMGVSGHYGSKDRSRIQGFMAGNQTTWNNQRQAAINNYAKKTFLSNPSGANTLGRQPGLSKEWAGTDGQA